MGMIKIQCGKMRPLVLLRRDRPTAARPCASFIFFYFSLITGSYFCYDNPAALQDTMIRDLNINEGQFMAFYSFYSWPNVVLCMFGGYLIDRFFGLRLGAIIFSLFVTVGQVRLCYSDQLIE